MASRDGSFLLCLSLARARSSLLFDRLGFLRSTPPLFPLSRLKICSLVRYDVMPLSFLCGTAIFSPFLTVFIPLGIPRRGCFGRLTGRDERNRSCAGLGIVLGSNSEFIPSASLCIWQFYLYFPLCSRVTGLHFAFSPDTPVTRGYGHPIGR